MFPTWPAKSEMMKRPKKKDAEHSPQAPEGGAMFAKLVSGVEIFLNSKVSIISSTGGSPDIFQASSFQLLKLENLLRWSLFTFIYNRSTIWISYIFHSIISVPLAKPFSNQLFPMRPNYYLDAIIIVKDGWVGYVPTQFCSIQFFHSKLSLNIYIYMKKKKKTVNNEC